MVNGPPILLAAVLISLHTVMREVAAAPILLAAVHISLLTALREVVAALILLVAAHISLHAAWREVAANKKASKAVTLWRLFRSSVNA